MKKITVLLCLVILWGCIGLVKAQKSVRPLIKVSNLSIYSLINRPVIAGSIAKPEIEKEFKTTNFSAPDIIEAATPLQVKYAMLLNVAIESINTLPLYNLIEEWYGTHYRMGGTTKKGIDCSAFTSTILQSIYSLIVPRTAREQYRFCEHIAKEDLKEGDLVFFNTRGGVSHVGLYLINNFFVHSSSSNGVMISSLDDSYYASKFISGGRINVMNSTSNN